MKSDKRRFFLYAGWILLVIGITWFYYLYSTAGERIKGDAAAIERLVMKNNSIASNIEAPSKIALGMMARSATDEVKDMLWPFLSIIQGAAFLLIHERSKESNKLCEATGDNDAS